MFPKWKCVAVTENRDSSKIYAKSRILIVIGDSKLLLLSSVNVNVNFQNANGMAGNW